MAYKTSDLVQVARLYYEQDLTQNQIAKTLGLNRIQVSRMIKAAKEKGIVSIRITEDVIGGVAFLQEKLQKKYGLEKVLIASDPEQFEGSGNDIARLSSSYIKSVVKDGDVVGLGWGMAISEMVRQLRFDHKRDVTVVPVVGGVDEIESIYNLNSIVQTAAEKMGGRHYKLYAPAVVDSKKVRDLLLEDSNVHKVSNLWSQLDILVVGIGALKSKMPSTLRKKLEYNHLNFDEMNIIGDVCCRYFGENGKIVNTDLDDRIISISPEEIRNAKMTIAIASGDNKLKAIDSVLSSGAVNVFITNQSTASKLFGYSENKTVSKA